MSWVDDEGLRTAGLTEALTIRWSFSCVFLLLLLEFSFGLKSLIVFEFFYSPNGLRVLAAQYEDHERNFFILKANLNSIRWCKLQTKSVRWFVKLIKRRLRNWFNNNSTMYELRIRRPEGSKDLRMIFRESKFEDLFSAARVFMAQFTLDHPYVNLNLRLCMRGRI